MTVEHWQFCCLLLNISHSNIDWECFSAHAIRYCMCMYNFSHNFSDFKSLRDKQPGIRCHRTLSTDLHSRRTLGIGRHPRGRLTCNQLSEHSMMFDWPEEVIYAGCI